MLVGKKRHSRDLESRFAEVESVRAEMMVKRGMSLIMTETIDELARWDISQESKEKCDFRESSKYACFARLRRAGLVGGLWFTGKTLRQIASSYIGLVLWLALSTFGVLLSCHGRKHATGDVGCSPTAHPGAVTSPRHDAPNSR